MWFFMYIQKTARDPYGVIVINGVVLMVNFNSVT